MSKNRNVYVWVVRLLMWLAVGLTSALTLFVVCYVLGDLLLDAVVKIPVFRSMMPADRVALMKKG